MRVIYYVIVTVVVIILYIIKKIIKNENFPEETVDTGNKLVNDINLSLSDFMKNYDKIGKVANKSSFIQNTYNKQKDILKKYNSDLKPLIDKTKTLINCADGNYVNSETGNCETCKAGGGCINGKFTECRGNTFQPYTGRSQCILCPKGRSSYGYGGTTCVACKQGTWINVLSNTIESKKCQSCGAGYINEGEGNSFCVKCPKNYYCVQSRYSKEEDINESLASFKYSCPPGSYTAEMASQSISDCLKCPDGKINTGCTEDCPVGFYCNNTYNADDTVKQNIYKCPEGTFNDKLGSTNISACLPCPTGLYSMPGSSVCKNLSECPDGYYIEGQKWVICPEGYYCTKGVKTACENGKWSTRGSNTCSDCPADSMCRNGVKKLRSIPETITDCLDGYYYDETTSKCVLCPVGFTCANGIKTQCNDTDGFSQYYDTVSNTCKLCPPGHSCNNGVKTICPDYSYTDDANGNTLSGKKICNPCPKGVLCKNGIKKVCEPGQTTVGSQSNECVPCDPGFFRETIPTISNQAAFCFSSDEPKNRAQNKCPPGYICPLNASKTATQKILCIPGEYANATADKCLPCEKGYACNKGIRTKCGDNMSQTPANSSRCLLNDSEYCSASEDCTNNCCAKYAWYSIYDSCIPKDVKGYTNCM